ncbi:MAG: hypothetical protein ACM31L_17400 [Actinomycetota bacterium]
MTNTRFSDLVEFVDGRPVVPPDVHPMPDLLERDAEGVLAGFLDSQRVDFERVVAEVEQPGSPLHDLFAALRARVGADNPFHRIALFRPGALNEMFVELHEHVMRHPVWRHPFFVRVFEGGIEGAQVARFARQYFNQIKNTRQCVAMAIGRFHGLADMPFGPLNERVSELTQIALAQLVADEYGVGSHAVEDYPGLGHLLSARTHIVMYRQLFDGLGIAANDQDEPMLPGVADNVLTQRLVAGHAAFTPLEALASVGLGMEWGVPEFFSLILGGLIRVAVRDKLHLTSRDLEVFIAHVRYDVLHAVSVMLATSLHMHGAGDLAAVKNACNTLMAGRYGMMTAVYAHVFGEPCASLADIGLDARYRLTDRRIETALVDARRTIAPATVVGGEAYRISTAVPFVFA